MATDLPPGPELDEAVGRAFLFTYRHEGAEWCFEIPARNEVDARARLAGMQFATYEGEIHAKVPATAGPLIRAAVWLRNLVAGRQRLR